MFKHIIVGKFLLGPDIISRLVITTEAVLSLYGPHTKWGLGTLCYLNALLAHGMTGSACKVKFFVSYDDGYHPATSHIAVSTVVRFSIALV